MSVFNNGFFQSSVTELVDNVNALDSAQKSYLDASIPFIDDVEALGGLVANQFNNPKTVTFDDDYVNLFSAVVPAGLVWCTSCVQVKSNNEDVAVTKVILRLTDNTGAELSPQKKRFYAGSQNDITYFALSASWIFENPVEQSVVLQGATTQTGSTTTGEYAVLNPSGGVGAFDDVENIQGQFKFIMLKPDTTA
jgi:hypothetical protein